MLFENKAFASKFDIERKVSDEDTSISALANEIYRITMKLYDHEHTVVSFHHCALQNTPVFVDYANISEHTWYRTQRIGGMAFVASGFLLIAAGLFNQGWLNVICLLGMLGMVFGCCVYSWYIFASHH